MPPRHKWKNQFQIIEGNSKFHEEVRKIFVSDSFFSKLRCFQEVPVKDLCPTYPSSSHRFDWYIEDLNMIIELHGQQHYAFSNRGNIQYEDAQRAFLKGKVRDHDKQTAITDQGLVYKIISYKEYGKLTAEKLKDILLKDTTNDINDDK